MHAWQFVCEAREKGAKLITIDPQFTASAMHSDMYVPVRPGTDGAMMLAMANYIWDNGLADEDFLKNNTVAPFLVKEDGTYLHMSDLGVPATEGPLNAYGMPTVIDPVCVGDEAAGAAVACDEATSVRARGHVRRAGHRGRAVPAQPRFEIHRGIHHRQGCRDLRRPGLPRSRNWRACTPRKAPCT